MPSQQRSVDRIKGLPYTVDLFTNQEPVMFTALMSFALLGLVVVSGVSYSKKMDELHRQAGKSAAEAAPT